MEFGLNQKASATKILANLQKASVSIGLAHPENLTQDSIAIGSFHAMAKGILTLNGAVGSILREFDPSKSFPFPVSTFNHEEFSRIESFNLSTK